METTVITAENFDEIFKKYTSQDILNSNVIYYPMENGKFMCLKNSYGIDGIKTPLDNPLLATMTEGLPA